MKKTLGELTQVNPLIDMQFFAFADKVSDGNYTGGNWVDVEPQEGVIYAKLDINQETIMASNPAAYFSDTVSIDAFSIAVNLYFWSHMSFMFPEGSARTMAVKRFHALRDWAFQNHDEAGKIAQLID